jgi:hypothetical protein
VLVGADSRVSLINIITNRNVLSEDERMDSVLLALAELKQIKDILTGLLPLETPDAFDSFHSPITSAAATASSDSVPTLAPHIFADLDAGATTDADADAASAAAAASDDPLETSTGETQE